MKTYRALDVSKYFIDLASNIDENDLTNLKLQKILYFAQEDYVKKYGKALFSDQIQAWDLGPVIRSVYDTFKVCGAFPITSFDIKYESRPVDDSTGEFLESVWEKYNKYSANHLVQMTHKPGSAWSLAYKSADNIITIDLIKSN